MKERDSLQRLVFYALTEMRRDSETDATAHALQIIGDHRHIAKKALSVISKPELWRRTSGEPPRRLAEDYRFDKARRVLLAVARREACEPPNAAMAEQFARDRKGDELLDAAIAAGESHETVEAAVDRLQTFFADRDVRLLALARSEELDPHDAVVHTAIDILTALVTGTPRDSRADASPVESLEELSYADLLDAWPSLALVETELLADIATSGGTVLLANGRLDWVQEMIESELIRGHASSAWRRNLVMRRLTSILDFAAIGGDARVSDERAFDLVLQHFEEVMERAAAADRRGGTIARTTGGEMPLAHHACEASTRWIRRRVTASARAEAVDAQTLFATFATWCLTSSNREKYWEQVVGQEGRKVRHERTWRMLRRIATPDGVDPAVEEALRAVSAADGDDDPREIEAGLAPAFRDHVLLLAQRGVSDGFEHMVSGSSDLRSLRKEVERGLAIQQWPSLAEFDFFLRERLDPLVGSKSAEAGLLRSDVAWRCSYWHLLGRYCN
jgi:hypothetical protein